MLELCDPHVHAVCRRKGLGHVILEIADILVGGAAIGAAVPKSPLADACRCRGWVGLPVDLYEIDSTCWRGGGTLREEVSQVSKTHRSPAVRDAHRADFDIASVGARVHPLDMRRDGLRDPHSGLTGLVGFVEGEDVGWVGGFDIGDPVVGVVGCIAP